MVIKRALKMFECPPSLTEQTEDVTEIVKRLEKCMDTIVAKRVSESRLKLTHRRLWEETKRLLKKLKTVDTQDDKNRIVWEDTRSCLIDNLKKLTTPCPFDKQEMFGRDNEISAIKEELFKIQRVASSFVIDNQISAIREEFIKKQRGTSMFGRDDNEISSLKMEILKKLRGTSISIIIIGGVTGIGKTMLAQYLFDDPQVSEAFDVRDWINCDDFLNFDGIFKTDDRWFTLGDVIETSCGCQENQIIPSALIIFDGWKHPTFYIKSAISQIAKARLPMSLKIIVTTSNLSFLNPTPDPGYIMENPRQTYHLLGDLQEEESWALFESLALSSDGSNEEKTRILESKIGLKILNTCGTNPCVIKSVASILSTKITLEEWKHFLEVVWPSLPSPAETITNFSPASFKRLPFLMKRCLLYSSLFPKDYEFNKADLNLWWPMIEISSDVGDGYFEELQNMGYFIKHRKTNDNDTLSYKMPIFSFEFIKNVAKEYKYQSFGSGDDNEHVDPDTIQHVSFIVDGTSWHAPPWLGKAKNLRSFLFLGESCQTISGIESIITSSRFLQILNITMVNCEKLARYFGNLELLTSLRLGITDPDFITELLTRAQNLRVLDLQRSNEHIIFTQGFQKLVRLEYLYIGGNMFDELLPASCGELLSLSKSNVLMMGRNNAVNTFGNYNYIAQDETTTDYLKSEELSKDVYSFCERSLIWVSPPHENEDVVLKTLQAPPALKSLTIRHWNRLITVPQFLDLSSIKIMDCHKCVSLPSFRTLPKLKSFTLWNLGALEYLENYKTRERGDKLYFPSLESLMLANLPKLEAWKYDKLLMPTVTKLQISSTKIKFLPIKGNVVSLEANDISIKLFEDLISTEISSIAATLKTLNISAIRGLDCISIWLPELESMIIRQCHELDTLNVKFPSIKSLGFHDCGKLKKLSMACQDMTKLVKLEIECCPELDISNMIPWKSLSNLNHLTLMNVAKLESLPDGLICLAELKTLSICWVYDLKALPEWICSLKHLGRLVVRNCPSLTTVPESLGELLNNSGELGVEFSNCCALKRFPKTFPQNQSSQLVIKGCPKLENSMHEQDGSI